MITQRQTQIKAIAQSPFTSVPVGLLQRKCACGQHTIAGGECEECRQKREGTLQRAAINAAPVNGVPPVVHDVLSSLGQPLDTESRAFMEPRFGFDFSQVRVHSNTALSKQSTLTIGQHGDNYEQEAQKIAERVLHSHSHSDNFFASRSLPDFSRVRVHTDAQAAASAQAVNALAYTVGQDIVFGTGQYAPGTGEGRRLLAHELTHTLQQAGSDGHMLQRQQPSTGSSGGSTQLPSFGVPGTGLTVIPGPLSPSLLGQQIPLPAYLDLTNVTDVSKTPRFMLHLSPDVLIGGILGDVDVQTQTRSGTPPKAAPTEENQAKTKLINPVLVYNTKAGRLSALAKLSIASDYPPAYK
ncbi:MAG TPA: DUF4157 domain-containing protein, partial [Ktedonobacterales bacterium]